MDCDGSGCGGGSGGGVTSSPPTEAPRSVPRYDTHLDAFARSFEDSPFDYVFPGGESNLSSSPAASMMMPEGSTSPVPTTGFRGGSGSGESLPTPPILTSHVGSLVNPEQLPMLPLSPLAGMRLRDASTSPLVSGLPSVGEEEGDMFPLFPLENGGSTGKPWMGGGDATFKMEADNRSSSVEQGDTMMADFDDDICAPTAVDSAITQPPRPLEFDMSYIEKWKIMQRNTEGMPNRPSPLSTGAVGPSGLPLSGSSTSTPNIESDEPRVPRRKSSTKRPRYSRSRSHSCACILPDRPREGQKIFLNRLPTEILLAICEFAIQSPVKPPKCEHRMRIPRRATITNPSLQPPPHRRSDLTASANTPSVPIEQQPLDGETNLSDTLRIFRAKTLLNITLTCRLFHRILYEDPGTDITLWRSAARWCWNWLPKDLADVQGREATSQTSWRNLVAVFMRSENGLFCKKGGGKGGVESFGGKKSCVPASTWEEEKKRRRRMEGSGQTPRRLVLACAQPGPDVFTVTPDTDSRGWTISLSLRGERDYFIHLDEYGHFGRKSGRLLSGLERNSRNVDYFAPDIFEVKGDRSQLVRVRIRKGLQMPRTATPSAERRGKPMVQEVVIWNLSCIPEFVVDPKARAARCVSHEGTLLCNLFTHGNRSLSPLDAMFDPPEDSTLFCIAAQVTPPGVPAHIYAEMSPKSRGKLPEPVEEHTPFRWRRQFTYRTADQFPPERHLHYVICNLRINEHHAVALIRWNVRSMESTEELVDRTFHILDPLTGDITRTLEFPNLYWDFRHHDMTEAYNSTRHRKLQKLYNHLPRDDAMGAGNRSTRIHGDTFFLTSNSIISGSHDYCNWIWPFSRPTPTIRGVFTATRNDAAKWDPFDVLDDYYWDSRTTTPSQSWSTTNERAGWWVNTPNQVLCFWHGVALSHDEGLFAACRPGKLFMWDLSDDSYTVKGYSTPTRSSSPQELWMGRLAPQSRLRHRLKNWFVWEDVIPSQGLWLVFDDGAAVWLNSWEVLEACGVEQRWLFEERDFVFDSDDGCVDGGGEEGEDDDRSVWSGLSEYVDEEEEERDREEKRRKTSSDHEEEWRFRREEGEDLSWLFGTEEELG